MPQKKFDECKKKTGTGFLVHRHSPFRLPSRVLVILASQRHHPSQVAAPSSFLHLIIFSTSSDMPCPQLDIVPKRRAILPLKMSQVDEDGFRT